MYVVSSLEIVPANYTFVLVKLNITWYTSSFDDQQNPFDEEKQKRALLDGESIRYTKVIQLNCHMTPLSFVFCVKQFLKKS